MTPLRISAVSFLNTKPLVWGFLHAPQPNPVQLKFELPSACADSLASGSADIGIIPTIEMYRQKLPYIPGLGIASTGSVRSIFLVSRVPAGKITRLAVDTASRTSVALARVILSSKYQSHPETIPCRPELGPMLEIADAALIIGDPALRLDPANLPWHVYDLGAEWTEMTGLPMVYALWSGPRAVEATERFHASYRFGRDRLDEIVTQQALALDFPQELVRAYLTRHIEFELGADHERGLALYLKMASELA